MHPVLRIGLLLRRVKKFETRNKFQKIVHILQVMGAPFPESFDLNHYGAYSSGLQSELDAFSDEGLVEESEEISGTSKSYSVKPTDKILQMLKEFPNLKEPAWLEWAESLNRKSPCELEGISTVLFLHQRRWPEDSWENHFQQLKPHLFPQYSDYKQEALELLDQAGAPVAA